MTLDEMVDGAFKTNKRVISEGGDIMPMLLMHGPKGVTLVGVPQYAENRRMAMWAMSAALNEWQADFCVFTMEAWVAVQTAPYKEGDAPPSERADKKEALTRKRR